MRKDSSFYWKLPNDWDFFFYLSRMFVESRKNPLFLYHEMPMTNLFSVSALILKQMNRINDFYFRIKAFLPKRILGLTGLQIVILGGLIAMLFLFSDSRVTNWLKYDLDIRNLESQIEFYRHRSEEDRLKLNELQSNTQDLEKFARENYLMKRDNEDLFIIND
jgi:cell division protein FtsB